MIEPNKVELLKWAHFESRRMIACLIDNQMPSPFCVTALISPRPHGRRTLPPSTPLKQDLSKKKPSMGPVQQHPPGFANHLPDEILLDILDYIPKHQRSQSTLASLCLVSRQWYNIFIRQLYEEPYIAGRGYELFVRTICPSLNLHVRRSPLAGLGINTTSIPSTDEYRYRTDTPKSKS